MNCCHVSSPLPFIEETLSLCVHVQSLVETRKTKLPVNRTDVAPSPFSIALIFSSGTFLRMAGSNSAQYEDRGYILKIVQAITLALAFTLLGSRLYVRFKITKNPGWDDFFIVLAMVK